MRKMLGRWIVIGAVVAGASPLSADPPATEADAKVLGPVVSFKVGSATNVPGSSVLVDVTVAGFRSVSSAQGTLAWNASVLRWVRVESLGWPGLSAAGSFGTQRVSAGSLSFSWDDPSAHGVTLPDGSVAFSLRFDLIGSVGSSSPVALVDSIAVREVAVNFEPAVFASMNGMVFESAPVPPGPPLGNPVTLAHGVVALTISTVSGKYYSLEYTDRLPAVTWTTVSGIAGVDQPTRLVDATATAPMRFYRVRVE